MSGSTDRSLGRRTFVLGTTAAAVSATALTPTAAAASFGYTDDGSNYVVDTGANLVFKVSKTNGDLTSLVHRGTEYQGYGGKNSHVESGLGTSTVTIAQSGSTILVSVAYGTLKHYYAARSGENNVYLWTNKADTSVSATRYIVRVKAGLFLNDEPDSYTYAPTTIESADVFAKSDGQTRSKHYSKLRVIDYDYIGWTTGSVGLWIVRSNHEKASGGPFYRSLLRHQSADGGGLYEILCYGENQTESERFGLQGPYVIAFTDGGAPSSSLYAGNLATSWADSLGISGYTAASGRGRVAGVGISGRDTAYAYTVGLANSAAQYWGSARASDGYFSIAGVLPGSYTLTVFKGELAVYTTSVTVTAGGTTTLNSIAIPSSNDPSNASAIWRIGAWDGTPSGFKNADLMTYAHPSDVRAASWTGNVVVGSGTETSAFPCYLWKDVNSGIIVYFKLTAAQAAAAHTLRIGVTTAYANGRPQIVVNDAWTSAVPSPPTQPSTRSLTVGSYRGNNYTFTYSVPASAWLTDTGAYNTLKIYVASGSGSTSFLSAGTSIDAVDLLT
ncbi:MULTISPECIES: rhamnogalacturonan lyase B N-terminal domain-containing protein [unclassified Streptomyces]|uniref:rhamnogalacturonan lyase B N-terminal domain-containing protein n=1 Tax=unclassified Streptomyces TaxID=2593676 RepID=UPI001162097F|nr:MULTISPECIES: rhamnogalacturonan lyase B N-terminal domain-containing protein [unclassified Streptomyces]NMI61773.1 rhamnogalacturonase B precursor [Streptomyces sp. RLA2-12]QDN60846.1 rhamnogalacturonase B precursor [Streptomyces sp. S1D4-20]QDN70900.1 rhamnogalacturonase B precursor [Streptomyces sp. S1D4-14]QDO53356.1 rhamnogalacturonase B precursor [Streptomyces sp. RLB3-5]QDO63601.1 rhamnogalacturonase B precursor [Streptomyces sp. RLB1-8]